MRVITETNMYPGCLCMLAYRCVCAAQRCCFFSFLSLLQFRFVLFCTIQLNCSTHPHSKTKTEEKKIVEIEPLCKRVSPFIWIVGFCFELRDIHFIPLSLWYFFLCYRCFTVVFCFTRSKREKKVETHESMNEMIHFDKCFEHFERILRCVIGVGKLLRLVHHSLWLLFFYTMNTKHFLWFD